MKSNHIPRRIRLQNRINALVYRYDKGHVKSPHSGNPYYCCAECGIHDPQLSIDGKHFSGCNRGGIPKQIEYYKFLLKEELND